MFTLRRREFITLLGGAAVSHGRSRRGRSSRRCQLSVTSMEDNPARPRSRAIWQRSSKVCAEWATSRARTVAIEHPLGRKGHKYDPTAPSAAGRL